MKIHALTLESGVDLLREIEEYVSTRKITLGVILSAVGDVSEAKILNSRTLRTTRLSEAMDILSISGTASPVRNHLHIVFGRDSTTVLGGHLTFGCVVGNSAEIIIGEVTPEEFVNGDIPIPAAEQTAAQEPDLEPAYEPEDEAPLNSDPYDTLVTDFFNKKNH